METLHIVIDPDDLDKAKVRLASYEGSAEGIYKAGFINFNTFRIEASTEDIEVLKEVLTDHLEGLIFEFQDI